MKLILIYTTILLSSINSCNLNNNKDKDEKNTVIVENLKNSEIHKTDSIILDNKISIENKSTIYTSSLNLKFIDVETGYFIVPNKIYLRNPENNFEMSIGKEKIYKNGTISFAVPDGKLNILISADGYKDISTHIEIMKEALDINFKLDPVIPNLYLTSEYIEKIRKPNAMTVVGYIVDDINSTPLSGVHVHSKDNLANTFSEKNGFFKLTLPLPENENSILYRSEILFEYSNYISESVRNFDMWSNGDMILSIRLNYGKGTNKINILQNREAIINILDK